MRKAPLVAGPFVPECLEAGSRRARSELLPFLLSIPQASVIEGSKVPFPLRRATRGFHVLVRSEAFLGYDRAMSGGSASTPSVVP